MHSRLFQVLIAGFGIPVFQGTSEINCRVSCGARKIYGICIVCETSPYISPIFCWLLAWYFQTGSSLTIYFFLFSFFSVMWGIQWSPTWVHPFSVYASLTVAFRPGFHKQNGVERWDGVICSCVQQSVWFLSIYRCLFSWKSVLSSFHASMNMIWWEDTFSAAHQGDQISQGDFSRNYSVYFCTPVYLKV